MGMSGLPDIYIQSTRAAGPRAEDIYISGKPRVPMLQLLCTTCLQNTITHVNTKYCNLGNFHVKNIHVINFQFD